MACAPINCSSYTFKTEAAIVASGVTITLVALSVIMGVYGVYGNLFQIGAWQTWSVVVGGASLIFVLTFLGIRERRMEEVYQGIGCYAPPQEEKGVERAFDYLFNRRENFPASEINMALLKSVVYKRDPKFVAQFREILKREFKRACEFDGEDLVRKTFIGNLLSLLPYTYPESGFSIEIPCQIDGKWQLVNYILDEKIKLSPGWFSSPIYAYGLIPSNCEAPPILSFLGTTYPAGDGFIATLLADFTPFFSVGHLSYFWGGDDLRKWLEGKKNVHAYGVSLGGALAIHATRNNQKFFSEVNAYNPPGLYPWNGSKYDSSVEVNIYHQEWDIISSMGLVPRGENVHIYNLIAETWKNPLNSHNLVFSAGEKLRIKESKPSQENWRITRIALMVLHFLCAPVIFFPLLALQLVYRPFELMWRGAKGCISRQGDSGPLLPLSGAIRSGAGGRSQIVLA